MQNTPGLGWARGLAPTASAPAALAVVGELVSEVRLSELAMELWEPVWELGLIRTNPHHNRRNYSRSRRTTLS